MPGSKLPILTITNKQYFRDDGLYIYSSTDGQLDIVADTTAKITAPTITIEGITTYGSDGVYASGGVDLWGVDCPSSNTIGWIKVDVGYGSSGYIPVFSSNALA
jgi:hypothetical protein